MLCACRSGAWSCGQQTRLCAGKAAETRACKWWKYNSFAAGGCSTDLVLNLALGCSDGISGVSILQLEAISLRQVVYAPVSDPALDMFLQPPGSTGKVLLMMLAAAGIPWTPVAGQSWGLGIMSCWGGFRSITLNFLTFLSFKTCTLTFQPQKYFKDICDVWESLGSVVLPAPNYLTYFVTRKVKWLPIWKCNNKHFFYENSICKKINLESCLRLTSNRIIWSFCHHDHLKKGKHKSKTLKCHWGSP